MTAGWNMATWSNDKIVYSGKIKYQIMVDIEKEQHLASLLCVALFAHCTNITDALQSLLMLINQWGGVSHHFRIVCFALKQSGSSLVLSNSQSNWVFCEFVGGKIIPLRGSNDRTSCHLEWSESINRELIQTSGDRGSSSLFFGRRSNL